MRGHLLVTTLDLVKKCRPSGLQPGQAVKARSSNRVPQALTVRIPHLKQELGARGPVRTGEQGKPAEHSEHQKVPHPTATAQLDA